MKTTIIRLFTTSTLLLGCCCFVSAQTYEDPFQKLIDRQRAQEEKMIGRQAETEKRMLTEFEKKRAEYNQRFIEYLGRPWQSYKMEQNRQEKEKPAPDVYKPIEQVTPIQVIPRKEDITIIDNIPQEDIDLTIRDIPQTASHVFDYYGAQLKVELTKSEALQFNVGGSKEKQVAQAMKYLTSSKKFMTLVDNCVALRERYNMCDWGYVMLTDKLAKSYYGESNRNESVMLRAFILTQTGYDIRIGSSSAGLELLLYIKDTLYNCLRVNLKDRWYYLLTSDGDVNVLKTYKDSYSSEVRACNMIIDSPQIFVQNQSGVHTCKSGKYAGLQVTATANKNLIDFYNDYPICDWVVYAISGMSNELSEQVVESLRRQLTGKSEKEKVACILNLLQTGLKYAYDEHQFKTERPLFTDEVFYYPGCDCEDHAILFAYLVHRLVGLDVIFLHYKQSCQHLTTAVRFNDNGVVGDYILFDGVRYVMCDPTIKGIGASIGVQMSECRSEVPKCYKINFNENR